MISWCLSCNDFSEVKNSLENFGLTLSEVKVGVSKTPAGALLKYEFANMIGLDFTGLVVPFFIKWSAETIPPVNDFPTAPPL